MAKKKPSATRVYDPQEGRTHYQADMHSGNVTLCGQTDWLCQPEPGYETERAVDCTACLSVVEYVQNHKFGD
ncbi:hypothetical protein SKUL_70 [Pseudomonas phage Skulduggery]|uniref:Uncharacterized protein n=1 Tax=Pseudomonas phage Skulduggery TaxID=2006671 RepID=A0A1Y0T053_9CAUD|nr:hypothetical protein PP627_gp70 [Pseudomonas phage Skulduggery]ARV77169.1 hypothetical protein SKUL_70 [Pseudomonas phage Skulduggery]